MWVTFGSHLCHLCVICGSYLGHICVIFVSLVDHIWVIFGSYVGHLWVVGHMWVIVGSHSGHLCVIYLSYSGHNGVMFGSYLNHIWVIFGIIFCTLGNLWSPSWSPNCSYFVRLEICGRRLWSPSWSQSTGQIWVDNCTSTSLGEVFPVIPTSPRLISLDMAHFVNINIAWSDLVGNI